MKSTPVVDHVAHAVLDDPSKSSRTWLVLLVLFLVALSIRVIDIGGRSLWVDEGATAMLSRPDLTEILRGDDSDPAHPSGYYALIHLTSQVSDSETGLRLPSALIAALAVVVTYLVGVRLDGHQLGLTAAAILALSPLDLWYAQEARQPIFAAGLVIVAVWGLVRRGWIGYVCATLALLIGLYIDYITAPGWVAVGAIWFVLWFRKDRARFIDWLVITGAATVLYAPGNGRGLLDGLNDLITDEGAGNWYGRVLGSNGITSNPIGLLIVSGMVVAIVFAVANRLTGKGRGAAIWASLVIAGFTLGTMVSPVPRAYSVKKIVVVGWPVLALIIAFLVLNRLSDRWRKPAIVGLLAVSALASAATFAVPKDDWRSATAYIDTQSASGDVAWTKEDVWAADAYLYYQGELPIFIDPVPGEDLPKDGDVWLITYRRPQDVPDGPSIEAEAWLDEHWELIEEIPFYRLAVRRYSSPG